MEFHARTKILGWLTFDNLEIKEKYNYPQFWIEVAQGFTKIDEKYTVSEKLNALTKSQKKIVQGLNLMLNKEDVGADDLFPILIYILIKSQLPRMYSNLKYWNHKFLLLTIKYLHSYINLFITKQQKYSYLGYTNTQIKSAISFIENLSYKQLKITQEEFDLKMKEN